MDLDSLAHKAGDVTAATPDQLRAGRQRMDALIRATEQHVHHADRAHDADIDTLDELLRATHPSSSTGRRGMSAAVTPHRQGTRRRRTITALVAAAAVTALVALISPFGGAPSASAREVLLVTAHSAGQQPDTSAGAQHWYVGMESDAPDTEPFSTELWFSRSEPTLVRDEALAAGYLAEEGDEPRQVRTEALVSEDRPITTSTWSAGGEEVTWDELETLPTDPAELERLLRRGVVGAQAGEDVELWSTVTGLLTSPAPPALRQALWEVAARIPGVEDLGPRTDAAGRQGTAIMHTVGDDEHAYSALFILDPDTGAMLEHQNLDADGNQEYRMTVLTQEPVATVPVPDPPLCGPGSQPERSC